MKKDRKSGVIKITGPRVHNAEPRPQVSSDAERWLDEGSEIRPARGSSSPDDASRYGRGTRRQSA